MALPEGMYERLGDTVQLIASATTSPEHLRLLEQVLRVARDTGQNEEQVAQAVEVAVPEAAGLLERTQGFPLEVKIGLLIALVSLLLTTGIYDTTRAQGLPPDQVQQIVEQAVRQATESQPATPAPPPPHRSEGKVGRNAPCPCGSGVKYKRCHGR
jgi:hypothetical protein